MTFNPGFDINPTTSPLGFNYGTDVFGPPVELRTLDAIRASLADPYCSGPDPVYAIVMDIGRKADQTLIHQHHLLYGAVTYATGKLGAEPVRSQGHIHKTSDYSGWSTPEVYEIWSGKAIILMQEKAKDDPGRCFAVNALPGDIVLVPPYWAHATISASPDEPLTFGAWCVRDYGFIYDGVRAHGGLAWHPFLEEEGWITWHHNDRYRHRDLTIKSPRKYKELGIVNNKPIYTQFMEDSSLFDFVVYPEIAAEVWNNFIP